MMNVTTSPFVTPVPWFVYAAPVVLAGLLFGLLWWSRRGTRVEDPARLRKFLEQTQSLDWSDPRRWESIKQLYNSTVGLFEAEVQYYYETRSARRRAAVLFRVAAFAFGSAGIICPLLAAAVPAWSGVSGLGYVLLALATVCFAGNGLFGGTSGHIRSVVTQYQLEALLTKLTLSWNNWVAAQPPGSSAKLEGAFELLQEFTADAYQAMAQETDAWATALRDSEQSYRARYLERGTPAAPAP